jgi:hypothetical protein
MDYHHKEITLNPAITLTIPITKSPPSAWDNRNLNHLLDNKTHIFSHGFLNFSTQESKTNVIEFTPEIRPHQKHSPTNAFSRIKPVHSKHKRLYNEKPPKGLNNDVVNNTVNRHRTKNVISNSPTRNVEERHLKSKSEPKLISNDSLERHLSNDSIQTTLLKNQTKEEDFVDYDKMCVL